MERLLVAFLFAAVTLGVLAAGAGARTLYVVNSGTGSVSPINGQTGKAIGPPIPVGSVPRGTAITPDGRTLYVANSNSNNVSVINAQTNQPVGSPIGAGVSPTAIAIAPDGKTAYVASVNSTDVSVIDTQTNHVVSTIDVGNDPRSVAVTPDGSTVLVANAESDSVSVIDAKGLVVTSTIDLGVGHFPDAIAIAPNGKTAYVANSTSGDVSVIDIQGKVARSSIKVGSGPDAIAITPDGSAAYVANGRSGNVSVIATATNSVAPAPIQAGVSPDAIAITPNGRNAYVANADSDNVSVIDIPTNHVVGSAPTGDAPGGIAIAPVNLPPVASFAAPRVARLGAPVAFDASASFDPDGVIGTFAWDFGRGAVTPNGGPGLKHAFARTGAYRVKLSVSDDEGCSTAPIPACGGSALAETTKVVEVVYPGVRIKCPAKAGPTGCRLTLQAVTKRRKGLVETEVTKAKLKAGKTAIAPLRAKRKFAKALGTAKEALVEETLQMRGSTRTTFRRLLVRSA